ncbi:MAG: ABC transporter ATP-binding protein [Pigmentiphaga sp.]|nr:ABC transporter ATP-binding protein [Pigmentiphaga sp.]
MIEVRDAVLSLGGRRIIRNVSLCVETGEMLALVGPNGSGKSTLLRLLFGALAPEAGEVLLDGQPLRSFSRRSIARRVAIVSQERPATIGQSVFESVSLGLLPRRHWLSSLTPADEDEVDEALERVGLSDLRDRPVHRLSGGERQRALIARALVQRASHLLLDEPTNHLDLRHQLEILELVRSLGCTAVVVLHDLNLAARCCSRMALLDAGRIVSEGPAEQVLRADRIAAVYGVRATPLLAPRDSYHLFFDLHAGDSSDGQNGFTPAGLSRYGA